MGPKDFLIIKALSLPLATHFRCFLSWGCFFGEIEGCCRLGANDKAACGCACCCWKQISCESFPLCYENWRHWNSYRLKWLAMLKNYYTVNVLWQLGKCWSESSVYMIMRRACVVKSNLIAEFQIWLRLQEIKNNVFFKAIRRDVTCFVAGYQSLWS